FEAGRLLVFHPGAPVMFTARSAAEVILLGGDPVGPRLIDWNFVASTQERLDAARERWRAGGFVLPLGDDQEWTPCPGDPEQAPPPIS
ncbi:MAG: pirin-like C-terminal cupin domain-containing protein, partial [Alphaproteobacteria bacterium]